MAAAPFYDFSSWHDEPECRRAAVSCFGGNGVMVLCLTCGKAADLQGLGGWCSLLESAETRVILEGELVAR